MNQTTKETRRRSYDAVLPKRAARCRLILETLGNRELTASEITEELVADGRSLRRQPDRGRADDARIGHLRGGPAWNV